MHIKPILHFFINDRTTLMEKYCEITFVVNCLNKNDVTFSDDNSQLFNKNALPSCS